MIRRAFAAFAALAVCSLTPSLRAQSKQRAPRPPERAIRRDIPLTNMIRRAFAAGTRDSTGRAGTRTTGSSGWTTPSTRDSTRRPSTLAGRETIVIHNNSDSALSSIQMRLDQNIFRGRRAARARRSRRDHRRACAITKLTVNGAPVDLNAAGASAAGGAAAPRRGADRRRSSPASRQTSARISCPRRSPPKATATLEVEWNFKLAGGPGAGHPHGLPLGRHAVSGRAVVSARRRVRRSAPRLGHRSVSRPVRVLQQLRPLRREPRRAGGLDRRRNRRAAESRARCSRRRRASGWRTCSSPTRRARSSAPTSAGRAEPRRRATGSPGTSSPTPWTTSPGPPSNQFVWDATRATIPGRGPIPVHIYYLPGRAQQYADAGPIAAPRARVLLEVLDAVRLPAAHDRRRPRGGHGVPDVHHVERRRGRPRDRATSGGR